MYQIIDTHCHIFSDSIAPKAIKSVYDFYGRDKEIPERMGTVSLLLELNDEMGVEKSIVTQVAMSPEITLGVNKYVLKQYKENPDSFVPLVSVHPENEDIYSMLKKYKQEGARGVKLHPDSQRFNMDDSRADIIYSACGELKLPVLMHCGDPRIDNSDSKRLLKVLKRHRNTTIIAAHFGGYSKWNRTFEVLKQAANFDNLMFDVSSSISLMPQELINKFIDFYGYKRFLYGSDYPINHPKKALEEFNTLNLSGEQKYAILRGNACRIYGIDL